jgi:hypothetical protein
MSTDMDTEIRKYEKIRYPGEPETDGWNRTGEVQFVEKIDGSNFRFKHYPYSEDKRLLFGSRNVLFHAHGEPQYQENVPEMFHATIEYVRNNTDVYELAKIEEEEEGPLWLYGESLFRHSVEYDFEGKYPSGEMPNFLGFDIWKVEPWEWMDYDRMVETFDRIGLDTVPLVRRVDVEDLSEEHQEIPRSEYRTPDPRADNEFDRQGLAEGVVIRNDQTGVRAKLVHDEFQEKNAIDFESPGKATTEAGRFIATYVTEARIRKQAHKLVEEGEYEDLTMPMMEDLPQAVFKDVMKEEGWEIFQSDFDLSEDVRGEIRSRGSTKCARTLKDEIRGFPT